MNNNKDNFTPETKTINVIKIEKCKATYITNESIGENDELRKKSLYIGGNWATPGNWMVEYQNGSRQIFTDEQFRQIFERATPDVTVIYGGRFISSLEDFFDKIFYKAQGGTNEAPDEDLAMNAGHVLSMIQMVKVMEKGFDQICNRLDRLRIK